MESCKASEALQELVHTANVDNDAIVRGFIAIAVKDSFEV